MAALWPERCKALVSVSGYLIGSQEANRMPLPPKAELQWWYQYYFATERGRAGYEKYRREFSKLIWQLASPKWNFDDATFDRSAASFDNPDHVAIVIHNYRWRLGLAEGEQRYEAGEAARAIPAISVPTITLEGDANGAPHPDPSAYAKRFSGRYEHRDINGRGIGHNLPQEAPQAFAQAVIDVDRYPRHESERLSLAALLGLAAPDAMRRPRTCRFDGATAWLNSPPLTAAELRGKVVLVDFWTYTCINWLRTLPYVRAWAEKYKDHGLVVIGVHTPEFEFEKNLDNVRRADKELRVDYPVAVDNDYAIWRAFANNAWPALYFIDAQGRIRHHHLGEGEYERSEKIIQQLLAEAGAAGVRRRPGFGRRQRRERPPTGQASSPRRTYLGRPERAGEPAVYAAPARLRLNQWAVSGSWTPKRQALVLSKPHGRIAYRFHARDLHLVMGPGARGNPVRFRVLIDGKPPGAAHGGDIDEQGNGTVTEQRMYQLIRQPKPIADRTVRDRVPRSGARGLRVHLRLSRGVQESVDLSQLRRHVDEPHASERACILRIIFPRCALTVISLIPSSAPTCLFSRPATTSAITSRSRRLSAA